MRITKYTRFHRLQWQNYLYALGFVVAVAVLCHLASAVIDYRSVGMFFLFIISLLALISGPGPVLMAAALSAFIWNFFFIPPRMTINIHDFSDALMVGMYFFIALMGGILTARVREREMAVRHREEQTSALYNLAKEINQAGSLDDIIQTAIQQLSLLFNAPAALFLLNDVNQLEDTPRASGEFVLSDAEWEAALWVFRNRRIAGWKTKMYPALEILYFPLYTSNGAVGVVGVRLKEALKPEEESQLETFLHQIAVAIERELLRNTVAKAKLMTESERLHKTLLNSVSHELRTPLATITGASSSLLQLNDAANPNWKLLVEDIFSASQRLNRLVKNLLDMSRLESGMVKLHLEWSDIEDLVRVVTRDLDSELADHTIHLEMDPHLPFVRLDFVLMQQVLANILLNAALHTPSGTHVRVCARVEEHNLRIEIEDNGPGFPPQSIAHIFEKFYRLPASSAGGTGLGLSIARGFVEAHGGTITAQNCEKKGARFIILIPVEIAPPAIEEEIE